MEVAPQVVDAEAAACLFGGEVEVEAGRHDKEQILTSKGHLETASAAHNIMDGLSTAEDVTPGERDADLTGTSVSPVDFGEVNKEVSTKPLGAAPTSDSLQGTGGAETVATVASEITVEGDAWPQDESKVPGEIPVVQGKSAVEGVSSQPETAALGTPGERDGDQTAASPVDFDEFSKEESIKPEGTAPASDYLQGTGGAETVATVAREIAPGPQDGLKVPSEVIVVQGETAVEGGSSQPETAVLGTADEKVEFLNQVGDGQESSSLLQVAGVADHCAALQKGAMDSKMDSKPLGGSEEVSLPQSAGSEGPNPPASQVQSGDPVLLQHEENITQEADDTSTMRVEDSVDSKMDWTPLIGSNEVTQSAGRQGQDLPSAPSSEAQNGDPVSLPREEDIILKADDTNTMPITDVIDSSMDWTPIGGSNEFTLPPENAVIEEQDAPTPQVPQLQNGDPNPLPIEEDASLKADDTSPLPHEEDITVKADSTSAISLQDAIDSKMEAKEISLKADDTSPTSLPHEEDITVQADSTGAISVQDTIDSKMEAKPLGGLKDVSPPQDASREVQDLPTPQASHVQNGDPVSLPHEENISRKVHDGTSTVPVKDVKHERDKKHETGRAKKHRKQRHKNGKKRKAEAESNTIDAEKVVKKGKTVSAATVNPPPEVPTVATRKITFKTRPRTPPSTPPEVAKKTAPRTPPKAPPKKMAKSTTPKSTTPRAGRGRKDDDGYAYFCALCHEFGELLCCEKCKQAFHLACLGLDRLPEADPWMCDNCLENKVECFDCKEFTAIEDDVLLCSFKNCSKFFHEECSKKWDRWDKGQLGKTSATKKPPGFTCPHHICDACGNTKTPKRSRLYRCLYCPVAYHENCAPDGTQFLEDVPGFMSCWKHDDDWKREIQTGERIMDLKTFFQQLPLPGVSNDFQVPQFIHEAVKKLNRKPSTYTHIRRNIYLAKKPRRRSEDEGMQCPCKASDSSKSACEKDCLCGMLLTSCSSSCGCGNSCKNVPFQKRPGQKLKAVKTQNCGWGLRADVDIRAGEFLVEYVGEVIDDKTCEERLWALKKQGETNFYMCEISREMVIDATFKGNLSRYINHSCEPNSELQKWNMEGEVRIGVFAASDIKKGSFITYDYKFVQFGTDQQCHCGSTDCRGQLGVRSHRAKDVSMSPLRSRPSSGSKFFEHNNTDTIGRAFRHRRDQCADSAGTKDLQFVRYNSAEARKWVGHRVAVWWPLDQKYYRGQIVSYNANSKKHVITYDDGDLEDLNMSKETWLMENVRCSHVEVASKA